jgi:beta-lactam-binding protein with PASTA domain
VSLVKSGFSAIGKLLIVVALAGTFLVGMVGVVYMSLKGDVISVPEIVGKDFVESEKELAALGLKIKKRADRYSTEKQNTVLEQLPKAGETVKTGQMILVVTSKTSPEGEEAPVTIKKIGEEEEDDTEKIEEMISDKPKKSNKSNTNTSNKKKADTKRDVIANKSESNSNSNSDADNSNKKETGTSGASTDKGNKNTSVSPTAKPTVKPANPPAATKPAASGDTRPRTTTTTKP